MSTYSRTIHDAASEGRIEVVKNLLSCCPSTVVGEVDKYGKTALHLAAENGQFSVVQLLLPHFPSKTLMAVAKSGRTVLHVAAWQGRARIVNLLLEAMKASVTLGFLNLADNSGKTALHLAAENGHAQVVDLLLQVGADADLGDKHGFTALHHAAGDRNSTCEINQIIIYQSVCCRTACSNPSGLPVVVCKLLEAGACVESRDNCGRTALHHAADRDNAEIATILLAQASANVDAADFEGRRALHYAVQGTHSEAVLQALLEGKADTEASDNEGKTALHEAAKSGTPKFMELLLAAKASGTALDRSGRTPLHFAAQRGVVEIVSLLLQYAGSEMTVDAEDVCGKRALHVAAWHGHSDVVELLLFQGKADVQATDADGRTALHDAAGKGRVQAVQLLLEANASVDSMDNEDNTPLHLALWLPQYKSKERVQVVKLLLDRGASCTISNSCFLTACDLARQLALKISSDEGGCDRNNSKMMEMYGHRRMYELIRWHSRNNRLGSLQQLCRLAVFRSFVKGIEQKDAVESLSLSDFVRYLLLNNDENGTIDPFSGMPQSKRFDCDGSDCRW